MEYFYSFLVVFASALIADGIAIFLLPNIVRAITERTNLERCVRLCRSLGDDDALANHVDKVITEMETSGWELERDEFLPGYAWKLTFVRERK